MASYITMASTVYTYDTSGRIIKEKYNETYNNLSSNSRDIIYLYDESGIVGAVQTYNTTTETFYFDRNIKGDVIGIYNASGTQIAKVSLHSWGNCTAETLVTNNFSAYNPIRYRGYYFDAESELYFLNARYYNPAWRRFISPDNTSYLDPDTPNGLNLYAYCNNDPVNYSDTSGHFPVLAVILGLSAVIGMGLTIGGVASDNNALTAIGLTMVAIPALISGGMAISLLTPVGLGVGITTAVAGIGTGIFASAEYQEAFSGNNWMLDAGMNEDLYNGLMITVAALATLGTIVSSVTYSFRIKTITEFGTVSSESGKKPGIKFTHKAKDGTIKYNSLEFHNHEGHKYKLHWQLNRWKKLKSPKHKGVVNRWTLWLTEMKD